MGPGGRRPGGDHEVSLALSVVIGALLLGYVSARVGRARSVRLVLARVVLAIALVTKLTGLASVDGRREASLVVTSIATAAVALIGLARFRGTDWYAWQRKMPPSHDGASLRQLVAIGALVCVIGGLVGPVDDGTRLTHQRRRPLSDQLGPL